MTSAEGDRAAASARQAVVGLPGVLDLRVDGPGFEVTFAREPSADVISRVRDLLGTREVRVVWYEGAHESLGPEASATPSAQVSCGVCGTDPAPWPHTAVTRPGAAAAAATAGNQCDRWHELLGVGDFEALAARLTVPDLPDDQKLAIVNGLR
jgi:hypothetical protein